MQRISRKYISHILASGIREAKWQIGVKLTTEQIFTITDAATETICNLTTMVVQAEIRGGEDWPGTFGVDEPWPEWVDVFELHEDFGDIPRANLPELPQPLRGSVPASLPASEVRSPPAHYSSDEECEQARRARTCSWDLDR